jgi:diaminopimelate decarboxylase
MDIDARIPVEFESVSPDAVASAVGTPVYVLSRSTFRRRLDSFRAAVEGAWPRSRFFYSVKANANPWLLREALSVGWGLDVCSLGDIALALRAGAAEEALSFAGVGGSKEAIGHACASVGFVNVCTPSQVKWVAGPATIGVRVASAANNSGILYVTPKFGLSADEVSAAFELLISRQTAPRGLHCHCGSDITDETDYADTLERSLMPVFECLSPEALGGLRHVNVGGGLAIRYDDAGTGVDPIAVGGCLGQLMRRLSERAGHELELHCEPGEWLVGPAGALLTRVTAAFEREGHGVAIVDASLNQFMATSFFRPNNAITNVSNSDGGELEHDVFGSTNSPMDAFCRSRLLPQVREGDLLVIHCTGAYGYTRGGRFNEQPQAPEVLVDGERMAVVRRRESMSVLDEFAPEVLDWT